MVVEIDEVTRDSVFSKPVYPLSRHTDSHARLTDHLREAGARAIVFDLRLDDQVLVAPPDKLAATFRAAGNVYLTAAPGLT